MDGTVLGMAFASMSGLGNSFTSDGSNTQITGKSFGDVLSNISSKNSADVIGSASVKNILAEMYGVQTDSENASLFDVLKAIGGMQFDDKAMETISKLFEELNSEDFDAEALAYKLVNGEDLPEEWAGMSLDDSQKLLKIIDLMLYAASDKKPYGENGVESILDLLFSDDEDMSETAAESGNVISESYFWQAMVSSFTNKYTEGNSDSEISSEYITAGINSENVAVNDSSSENEMIAIPVSTADQPIEMSKSEFTEKLSELSEALHAEISEKTDGIADDGISQEDKDKMSVFAVKMDSVSFADSELEALTGTAEPDLSESVRFSNIAEQIERAMRTEMAAAASEKNGSVRELNIKLNPEELGEINVKLTTNGETLTVAFTAENSSTAKLLSDNIRSLAAAISRNSDSETETAYLIQAADGSESAYLNLSAGFAESFGRGESQNSGTHSVYRESTPDTDEPAEEKILIQEAKLWQTV